MILKWMKSKCFLSIGTAGIHIKFDDYDNIIVLKGKNLDISPESSNGACKSTLIECIVYGLFGKLIKGLPHKEAVNKKVKKGLEIELCFEIDGNEYIVKRTRKPDNLILLKNGEDITQGNAISTQQEIENIVKLNYEAFINVVCFGEHNNHAFLACDPATKRSIVENLLGLEKYLKYCKSAKECLKEVETTISLLKRKYDINKDKLNESNNRFAQFLSKQKQWFAIKQKEKEQIKKLIEDKTKEMSETDDGNAVLIYQQTQIRIQQNKDKILQLEEKRTGISRLLDELKNKLNEIQDEKTTLTLQIKTKEHEINTKKSEINIFEKQNASLHALNPGVKCSVCFGTVDKSNYQNLIDHNNKCIENLKLQIVSLNESYNLIKSKLDGCLKQLNVLNSHKCKIDDNNNLISNNINLLLNEIHKDSKVVQPNHGTKELLLKEQLNDLNERLEKKQNEIDFQDPYVDILGQTKSEIDALSADLVLLEKQIKENDDLVPYYEFWIHGFGDDGIRAFIIDDVLPALNSRINYFLQFLIDNKITLNFNNKFDATIERNPPDGDPFVYNATSGGERRLINLAISQAFSHIMMLSSGAFPNILSLDEVALNVDGPGVYGIYKMICELSKDRQIFVTTHCPNLSELLNSCKVLTIVKKDGFSELQIE